MCVCVCECVCVCGGGLAGAILDAYQLKFIDRMIKPLFIYFCQETRAC